MLPMGTRDLALRVKILPMGTREKKRNPRQMMASCLSKLHSDPMFYIAFFSPLGPHSGSGAVPRTPATPRHSPPLRGRPRDVLYYYYHYLVLQQICCHAFLEEQAWCSMGSSSFLSSTSILLDSWKLRNFLRPINASMKEATAKRPLLKEFDWKSMIFQSRQIVAALPNRPWLSRSMVF